jgi:hypothetical protein
MVQTLAALKVVAYGGPVALALSVVGSTVLGVAFFDKAGEHYDVAVVGGVTLIVLGWVEIALARRFAAHEVVEKRQYGYVASIADSAAQSLTEITKATREHTSAVESFRAEVSALRGDVVSLARRVAAIEDRYMRPGITLPPPRRASGGED